MSVEMKWARFLARAITASLLMACVIIADPIAVCIAPPSASGMPQTPCPTAMMDTFSIHSTSFLASAVAVKANRQAMDNMTLIFRTSPHGPPRRLGSASMQAQLAKENKEVN
ncbi:hypothetical protein LZK80_17270 [Rhizobium leguminosarum]|nr:hypothetical protein LZK80_17270 [Rhizobium leguminosarum]